MRRSIGSRPFFALSLICGLALCAPGCGSSQADGDIAKSDEVRQSTRSKREQSRVDGTYNQVKGQAPAAGPSGGSGRSARYNNQRH